MDYKNIIPCNICAFGFDSNFAECKKCENYKTGLNKYGRTKTNEEYQIEILINEINNLNGAE